MRNTFFPKHFEPVLHQIKGRSPSTDQVMRIYSIYAKFIDTDPWVFGAQALVSAMSRW